MNRILWNKRGGEIDEVVFNRPQMVHIEQMGDECWWIGVDLADGSYWAGSFTAEEGMTMTFSEQESDVAWNDDRTHEVTT